MGRLDRIRGADVVAGVVLAVGLIIITPHAVDEEANELDAGAQALCAIVGLSLAFWRAYPLGQYVGALSATVVYALAGYPGGPVFAVTFGSLIALVANSERRTWMPAAVVSAALILAVEAIMDGWSLRVFALAAMWVIGAAIFGEAARLRQAQMKTIEARAEYAERTREEEARRKVAEERLRIARDVHDVVGHSLATIALQAGVAEHLLDGREPRARESMAAIRRLSRGALGEVSAMLTVLRGEDGGPARAPTPDVRHLPRLVDEMRSAGLQVELELDNAVVPEVVAGAAYRIVQESLTNVVRHAGDGASAWVRVRTRSNGLEVEVSDDGRGAPPGAVEGNGLTGMRERAAALGGSFEAGSAPGGGFRVQANLPAP